MRHDADTLAAFERMSAAELAIVIDQAGESAIPRISRRAARIAQAREYQGSDILSRRREAITWMRENTRRCAAKYAQLKQREIERLQRWGMSHQKARAVA